MEEYNKKLQNPLISLRKLVEKIIDSTSPIMIHSDIYWSSKAFLTDIPLNREEVISAHINILRQLFPSNNLWFPCFNYDFFQTRIFNPHNSNCQVGPLGEYIRLQKKSWRTLDPVFSFTGLNNPPHIVYNFDQYDPFDDNSLFAELINRKGYLLLYGAKFDCLTILHRIENLCGRPLYRYDKAFKGSIIEDKKYIPINFSYHVRPWKRHLDYGWDKLRNDLIKNNCIDFIELNGKKVSMLIGAQKLVEFWRHEIKKDPFYLLDVESRDWIIPLIEKLGRRFEQNDFE
jgi:aminoglycoside N3'-acetyltransferase